MSFLPSGEPTREAREASQRASDVARSALSWLDEATEGASRMRAPLRIEVIRPVTEEDLAGGFLTPAPPPTLRETKASHHTLAKLLAAGRSRVEASRITGYSTSYISQLAQAPLFRELLLHYSEVEEIAAADTLGAMKTLGMDMLAELRKRVEENPEGISVGQLQDGIKLLLVEPLKAEALRGGMGGTAVAPITISFIASSTPQASEVREGTLLEGEANK